MGATRQSLPLLVWGQLEGAAQALASGLGLCASLTCSGLISSRSNSASPPSTVSMSLPCGVVVSAQASPRDVNPAPFSVMEASVFNRSRVLRASRSSRVTISTSRPVSIIGTESYARYLSL